MRAEEFNKELYGDNYLKEDDYKFAEAYAEQVLKNFVQAVEYGGVKIFDQNQVTDIVKQALKK